jgi:ribosomal protein S18 acetylase RimI-like enzyme
VQEIYDLAKPDEMRGSIDLRAIRPLAVDDSMQELFRASTIVVMHDGGEVVGFAGSKGTSISWLFVHPAHRRRGIARRLFANVNGSIARHDHAERSQT